MQVTEGWHWGRDRGVEEGGGGRGGGGEGGCCAHGQCSEMEYTERGRLRMGASSTDEYACSSFHSITRTNEINHRWLIASDGLIICHDLNYKGEEQQFPGGEGARLSSAAGHLYHYVRTDDSGRSHLSGGARTQCKSEQERANVENKLL